MEYATPYRIGHDSDAPKATAKKAVPAVERVRSMDAADKGCKRNKQRQTQVCPHTHAADGFLRTMFLPRLEASETAAPPIETEKMQADFYASLHQVASHYHVMTPMDTSAFRYPYNLMLSVWDMEQYLKRYVKDWNGLRLVQEGSGKTLLISEEQYSTGTSLYYIPVLPLYRMLKDKQTKKAAQLLLSVCTYLYQIADIPYYRQEGAYVYWEYEMIADWIEQDDEAEWGSRKEEIQVAVWCGDKVEQKLFNRKNLDVFEGRMRGFTPKNDLDKECLNLANAFFTLYRDYPSASVFQHARYAADEEEGEGEVIAMCKYISFIADAKGWLFETLADCVNNEFNECGVTEEPTLLKRFEGTPLTSYHLDFENRLFPLLGDLCYLLNNY